MINKDELPEEVQRLIGSAEKQRPDVAELRRIIAADKAQLALALGEIRENRQAQIDVSPVHALIRYIEEDDRGGSVLEDELVELNGEQLAGAEPIEYLHIKVASARRHPDYMFGIGVFYGAWLMSIGVSPAELRKLATDPEFTIRVNDLQALDDNALGLLATECLERMEALTEATPQEA